MDTTPNLDLPYIMAAQAQKHVTHNEAIRALDAIVQIGVIDRDLANPPGSPSEGHRYIVAAGATGAWTGHAGKIAAWQDGAWAFFVPREGWLAWVADEGRLLTWSGAVWIGAVDAALNPTPLVGVNTTANTTNRLAVSSPGSLFNHAGAGHQVKVNKAASGDTASLLFQTGSSGRAEIGTTGDDKLHLKVSADGSAWTEALRFDSGTGLCTISDKFQLAQRAAVTSFAVPTVRSSTANQVTAFDVMPNGIATDAGNGFAWIDICDSDVFGAANPTGVLRLAAKTTAMEVGSRVADGGTLKPLHFAMGGTRYAELATDGVWTFGPTKVVFNGNTASLPAPSTGTQLHIGGANDTNAIVSFDAYGVGVPAFLSRRARGTAAAPSACLSGDVLFNLGGFGYGASGYSNVGRAQVVLRTAEAWTDTAQGAECSIVTTATGTTSQTTRLTVEADGHTRPAADNAYNIGTSSFRWANVYAANGTIQTSDARDKDVTARIDGAHAAAAVDAITPVMFRWKVGGHKMQVSDTETTTLDGVTVPKMVPFPVPGNRLHAGFLAQEVKATMDAQGADFGVWGLDDPSDPNSRQWLRPDQLIPMLWAALRETRAEVAALRGARPSTA